MPKKKTAARAAAHQDAQPAASASPAVKPAAGAGETETPQELKRAPNTPAMMLMSPKGMPTMPSSPSVPNLNEGSEPVNMRAPAGEWEQQYQVPATPARDCACPLCSCACERACGRPSARPHGGVMARPPDCIAASRQTLTRKSPRHFEGNRDRDQALRQAVSLSLRESTASLPAPTPKRADAEVRMQDLSSSHLAGDVDTGVRIQESVGSDTVLLEMPRGSPAEICVRMNPGDRVLG